MKKIFLSLLIVAFAVMTIGSVMASTGSLGVSISEVSVNGVDLSGGSSATIAGFAGETIPIQVLFTSSENQSDAKVKAWIAGYRDNIEDASRRIYLIDGSSYLETLSLRLPSDINPAEEYTLYVRIESKTDYKEENFNLRIQRESYNLAILDIEADKTVSAGSNLALDVVLKNTGFEELSDVFVIISIPELGIQKKVYFEDLTPTDCTDDNCDKRDSEIRRANIRIPSDASNGVYELRVEAYNSDSRAVKTMNIAVTGTNSGNKIVAAVRSKEMGVGETASYELIIVNSGSNIGIYEITPEAADGLFLSTDSSIVTVPAGSSKVVRIDAKGIKEGTYNFVVNVRSDDGINSAVTFNAAVGKSSMISGNITVLTVVLVIIFVVLLVVLIVLLTKKPQTTEELEESYY